MGGRVQTCMGWHVWSSSWIWTISGWSWTSYFSDSRHFWHCLDCTACWTWPCCSADNGIVWWAAVTADIGDCPRHGHMGWLSHSSSSSWSFRSLPRSWKTRSTSLCDPRWPACLPKRTPAPTSWWSRPGCECSDAPRWGGLGHVCSTLHGAMGWQWRKCTKKASRRWGWSSCYDGPTTETSSFIVA